ncbi:class I SAM-dependent methyltransferase [Bacillus cereus]
MNWINYLPKFDYEKQAPHINGGAWKGHVNFSYNFVRFLKPKTIVELGTYYGTSFFSFCQAIKDEVLDGNCYAIDTWEGDPQGGFYGEEVYSTVKYLVQHHYPSFAHMIRSTFDKSLHKFEDSSIDLLHIDGFHSYESVLHDYTNWLPKLSENGVILFHDITVFEPGFGVFQLWKELKDIHPSCSFEHSHGLGILFPKGCTENTNDFISSFVEIKKIYIQ